MISELQEELKKQYGFSMDDCKIYKNEKLGRYILYCDNKQYGLKSLNREIDLQQLAKIIQACNVVEKYGVNTPQFIDTTKGKPYFYFGEDCYVLYPWIEGQILDYNSVGKKKLIDLADTYAVVVSALSLLPKERRQRGYLWNKSMLKRHIFEAETVKNQISDTEMTEILEWKISEMIRLSSQNTNYIKNMTWANSHGDYYLSQILFDKTGKVNGLIDFDSFSCLPIVYELIRCFYSATEFETSEQKIKILADYLYTFMKKIPLSCEDIYYMHDLYSLKIITSLYWFIIFKENPSNYTIKDEAIKYSKLAMGIIKHGRMLKEGLLEFMQDKMKSCGEDR